MSKPHESEQSNQAEEAVAIAAETMTGDLMQCLIDELKAAPKVWQEMPEHQQQDVIYRAQERVQAAYPTATASRVRASEPSTKRRRRSCAASTPHTSPAAARAR